MRNVKIQFTNEQVQELESIIIFKLEESRKSLLLAYDNAHKNQDKKAITEARNAYKAIPQNAYALIKNAIGYMSTWSLPNDTEAENCFSECSILISDFKEPEFNAFYTDSKNQRNYLLSAIYRNDLNKFSFHS